MSGAPGANSRGRGGKFRKFTRGGGKSFSKDLRPLDADGNEISMWSEDAQKRRARAAASSGSDQSESESESESEDEGGPSLEAAEMSREERKKQKRLRKEAAVARKNAQAVEVGDMPPSGSDDDSDDSDDDIANPNHSRAARKMVGSLTSEVGKLSVGSNRKERDSADAQAARERYQALHEQGKTDEARADLARLKVIREQRAAEAARRLAEKEEKEAQEEARRAERDAKMARIEAKKPGRKR